MEQNLSEKQNENLETIQLEQQFQLFDPAYTKARPGGPLSCFERKFVLALRTNSLPQLCITATVGFTGEIGFKRAFVPFDPEKGYHVTDEDFDPAKRKKKDEDILNYELNTNERLKGEFMLILTSLDTFGRKLSAEAFETLNRLRIQLSAGSMLLEGKRMLSLNEEEAKRIPDVYFARFYPMDTGELPPNFNDEGGQIVFVPNSKEQLATIQARFVLAKDEPKF